MLKKKGKNLEIPRGVDKKVLSFFMLSFPTLLIIVLSSLTREWWSVLFMILIAVYQFILLKQFVDHYYDLIE